MSLFQIIAALVMVAVAFILLVEIRRYMTAASERRTMNMVKRVGLDPTIVSSGYIKAIRKEIRQRCRSCTNKDVCERWLAGDEIGQNVFCPNAKIFESLKRAIANTG